MIRLMDIFFAILGLLVLGIFMIGAIVILLFTGERKVFYKQYRVGKGGKDFKLYKFATMLENSPNLPGGLITATSDPRVLPFGRFLRRTKVNELPQLINILLGDMSFVGPRPQARPHYSLYSDEQKKVIDSLGPGLTGVGSLFFRNEEQMLIDSGEPFEYFHDVIITPYKGELEIWYAKRRNVALYLKIICLTAATIIYRELNIFRYLKGLPSPPPELLTVLSSAQLAALLDSSDQDKPESN